MPDILFAQQGGNQGSLLKFIIWAVIIIFIILSNVAEYYKKKRRAAKKTPKTLDEFFGQVAEQDKAAADGNAVFITSQPARKKKRRKTESYETVSRKTTDTQPKRKALSRELSPLGEGARIEADPGTLDGRQIVASTVESTVKPELESITGIYETTAIPAEQNVQTLDLQKALLQPGGIRQGVIWSEILRRPEW
jgi:hypothetical protein